MEFLTFIKGTSQKNSWEFNQLKDKAIYSVVFLPEQDDLLPTGMQKLFHCGSLVIFKSNLKIEESFSKMSVDTCLQFVLTYKFSGRKRVPPYKTVSF